MGNPIYRAKVTTYITRPTGCFGLPTTAQLHHITVTRDSGVWRA
jgi:hypothetical protein